MLFALRDNGPGIANALGNLANGLREFKRRMADNRSPACGHHGGIADLLGLLVGLTGRLVENLIRLAERVHGVGDVLHHHSHAILKARNGIVENQPALIDRINPDHLLPHAVALSEADLHGGNRACNATDFIKPTGMLHFDAPFAARHQIDRLSNLQQRPCQAAHEED